MLFSRRSQYAIQAATYLAARPKGQLVRVVDMCRDLRAPRHFLAKVVQDMVRNGIACTQRGPGGGVTLARAAEEISILEIVEAFEGKDLSKQCLLAIPDCSDDRPCAFRGKWAEILELLSKWNCASCL